VTIARDVVAVSSMLKKEAFEPHGVGILEKIFDIGCSLADVLQLHPTVSGVVIQGMEVGARDYLMEMLRLCSTILGGSSRYVSLLAAKADECMHVGPRDAMQSDSGRVVDLEEGHISPLALVAASKPLIDVNGPLINDAGMFDFGALSDVSMAWLGTMSNETLMEVGNMSEGLYQHL